MLFYGRQAESEALKQALRLSINGGRLAVIKGQKGIGKSRLIREVLKDCERPVLNLPCSTKGTQRELAETWLSVVRQAFGLTAHTSQRRMTLANVLQYVMTLSRQTPCVVVLDECPRLDAIAPTFWADLQGVWDLGFEEARLLLVMTGSDRLAMAKHFDDASEPLFGRQDVSLTLRVLSPRDLRDLLLSVTPNGSREALLALYAVTGGVPSLVAELVEHTDLTRKGILRYVFATQHASFWADVRATVSSLPNLERDVLKAVALGQKQQPEGQTFGHDEAMFDALTRLMALGLVKAERPLLDPDDKHVRFCVPDLSLRFWLTFLDLPAEGRKEVEPDPVQLERFFADALRDWFTERYAGSRNWTLLGAWWDRQGDNTIELLAINELTHQWAAFDVKRQTTEIDLQELAQRVKVFASTVGDRLADFDELTLRCLSLETLFEEVFNA